MALVVRVVGVGVAPVGQVVVGLGQGVITIFSEDGDKFYLILNGVQQNPEPQANVRVDGLTSEFYSAKVRFADPSKGEITKNIPTKDAATGQYAEMTFKIKNKDGDMKLRYFGATPIQPNYTPPADMYQAHYGQAATTAGTTVTQTTVTTTTGATQNNNGGASISIGSGMGGGGLNMNINIPNGNPAGNSGYQQTTTTTQTTTDNANYNSAPAPAPAPTCQYPMDPGSFRSAKETVAAASFEDTKLSTAKTIAGANCLSTEQVVMICSQFTFEQSKLEFAKFAYPRTTDPNNYFKVNKVFTFDASKTDLNNFLSANPR